MTGKGRFEALLGGLHSSQSRLAQVPSSDLDVPIVAQLPPPDLPFDNALERVRWELVGLNAAPPGPGARPVVQASGATSRPSNSPNSLRRKPFSRR